VVAESVLVRHQTTGTDFSRITGNPSLVSSGKSYRPLNRHLRLRENFVFLLTVRLKWLAMSEGTRRRTMLGLLGVLCSVVFVCPTVCAQDSGATDWPTYGNDPGGTRYSPLAQINRENVAKLKVAWIFHTGDISDGRNGRKRSGFETTPILVDGTLYLTTPFNRVIALDPETGKQRWADAMSGAPCVDFGKDGQRAMAQGAADNSPYLSLHLGPASVKCLLE